jgi:Uncharacterized protein with conserved CXXC pairs
MEENKNIREMTCTVCPIGCRMKVTLSDCGAVKSVEGNTCARGKKYAVSEVENPVRTLTTTVKLTNSAVPMLPVKTSAPIPKSKLIEAMALLKSVAAAAPIKSGDTVIADFIVAGVNLVASKSID